MDREQKADLLIEQTVLNLLETEPINKINIKILVEKCGVNRNTFYYYYKNIPNLLESITKKMIDEFLESNPPSYSSLEQCFLAAIKLSQENKQAIHNIYHSANRPIFEKHLWHLCEYSISSFMGSFEEDNPKLTSQEYAVMKDFLKFECFGFVIDWLNHDMPDDVTEKVKTLTRFVTRDMSGIK